MRNLGHHVSPAHGNIARVALLLALVPLGACSGEFPVGDFSERGALLDGSDAPATENPPSTLVDGTVPAALPEPDATADFAAELRFQSITPAGDLDGDGKDDVAITATDYEHMYVLVRYGGPRLTTAASASAFVNTGASLALPGTGLEVVTVAAAGDIDRDGFDDLLVLGSGCDLTDASDGAFLVYGGPRRLTGAAPLADISAHFVPPVSEPAIACAAQPAFSAGDLDGDGRADLVLAARPPEGPQGFVFGQGEGLYLFYGRDERFSGEIPFVAADARLTAPIVLDTLMSGDVNGDGLSDLFTGSYYVADVPDGVIYVPGRSDRWSGLVNIQTRAIPLDGARLFVSPSTSRFGDLDGDGLSDVLLLDKAQVEMPPPEGPAFQLFYGTPGLFDNGIDFSQASAQLFAASSFAVVNAGDRDGDGDDELMDMFAQPGDTAWGSANLALVSGSRQRISGSLTVPEAEVAAQTGDRIQLDSFVTPVANDLDGDGASDVISVTTFHDDDGIQLGSQLNFHYGTLAPEAAAPELR